MAYHFRLPELTSLTIEQRAVLMEPNAIAISGGPGTGKSVVSLWRHIQNYGMGRRNSLLLTYTVSLEAYLKATARSENIDAGRNVGRTYKWTTDQRINNRTTAQFDEIIIDEAQDVNRRTYETIDSLTKMVSYSADDNQILYPRNATTEKQLANIFNNPKFTLHKNFRNTREMVSFVKSLNPHKVISEGTLSGPKPMLICSDGKNEMQTKIIKDIIDAFHKPGENIAVLVPLANHVRYWHTELVNSGYIASMYESGQDELTTIENIHITTFKSSKGLEFDTVIIPNFHMYKEFMRIYEEIVSNNDFYVVFTRAKRNLLLVDNSPTVNGNPNIPFLKNQIEKGIITVEKKYLNNSEEIKDLPF